MNKKRVLLSAGGTGGHLFPALALAEELSDHELLFVAKGLKKSSFFEGAPYNFREVVSSSFTKPWKIPLQLLTCLRGSWQARRILKEFRPDLVVGFGSFYTLPVLLAAWQQRIPIVLHEQNCLPGKVNKLFAHFAKKTAITFPASAALLKGETEEVLYPVRSSSSAQCPYEYFGLEKKRPTLLVFGGSCGAQFLGELLLQTELPVHWQLLHFTGSNESAEKARIHYAARGVAHAVKPFEKRIELAWAVASLALVRAGAGTLAEILSYQVPAVMVPYPFATDDHQAKNAQYVESIGGGIMVREEQMTPQLFSSLLEKDWSHEREKLQSHKKMRNLRSLTHLVEELL